MSIFQRDFLRRLIEDLARVLAVAAGLRQSGQFSEAEHQVKEAIHGLLGGLARDADALDVATLQKMLGDERLRWYAALLAERAEIRSARGDLAGALADRERARELGGAPGLTAQGALT